MSQSQGQHSGMVGWGPGRGTYFMFTSEYIYGLAGRLSRGHYSQLCDTSIDARLWRASLLQRIVAGASAKAVKVCAYFSVGFVSDRELFRFFSGHLETKEGTGMP